MVKIFFDVVMLYIIRGILICILFKIVVLIMIEKFGMIKSVVMLF